LKLASASLEKTPTRVFAKDYPERCAQEMPANLDETLISVWKQSLVDCRPAVTLDGRSFPVRQTSRSKLREVNFQFDGHMWRGLEQNPNTSSRWAQLAREGKKVMQFLIAGRYVANVVDGEVHLYDKGP
jgi:hypothetical protein